ncbi:hypothetical protein JRO89_XSUnG0025800 [Xanthoceras sorbifolium]|uniref:Sucrose phosphatase-like domain-containing protein n=1 Tax=Xanthoceras sorbifolium TaxID=99658 RepID=A0ABQ8H063_9ROSI|nr:hypothetical protein JRO89_XSUnG0025800 [Xanthoceras sorbifolium]
MNIMYNYWWQAHRVDDLRQRLRMRGIRCNLIFTRAATRLNVVPLFASRIQALRYLSIRWGIDLSKMVVFVGERGDTDYESLLAGLHKSLILRGVVVCGSEKLHHSEDGFKSEDVVPEDSTNVTYVEECNEAQDISAVLKVLQIK